MEKLKLPGVIHHSMNVLQETLDPKLMKADRAIPHKILAKAQGIAFLTTVKAGFVFTGSVGSGMVITRLPADAPHKTPHGWSPPSCIGSAAVGWGLQVGANLTDSIIILNTPAAVKAFAGEGQLRFGANVNVTAGPVGRDAAADAGVSSNSKVSACYSYSHSKGVFAGISLAGQVIATRAGENKEFYGTEASPRDILEGRTPLPSHMPQATQSDLDAIYALLSSVCPAQPPSFADEGAPASSSDPQSQPQPQPPASADACEEPEAELLR